ncbi:Ribosomal lysine N-methyltransferase 4 [Elasticomyces elasticus]|nr:Ribosomal lysine N-methyltransferase 4 [Elasticomyces elasticus]KAK4910107.1 Ribosomal lysine N-methyltransferase 4 [Elasticomyces elasticus]KAK5753936.1 Ribosomal lysine N-methyltransferase 4 [Elasticomyces elasticus]
MTGTAETDDFQAKSQSFLAWLQQHGTTISPKIELADLRQDGCGRGVLAVQDIEDDEELFSVPRTSILTIETSTLPAEINAQINDPWLGLITAMVLEHSKGDGSAWKAYFDVLPERFDTPMFWSEEELAWLRGSAVVDKIGRLSADKAFSERVIPIIRQHPEVFGIADRSDDDLFALCHRMGSTIMAYAFDLEKPSAEQSREEQDDGWEEDEEESENMLNADGYLNNAKLYYEEDRVVMKSIKPIPAGGEIFNDYGSLPTGDVLRRYGYVTSNYSPYDVVEVSQQLIRDVAKEQLKLNDNLLEQRVHYLEEQGVLEDAYDVARPGNEDVETISEELCILVNALTMSQTDFDKLQTKEKLPKPVLATASAELLTFVLRKRQVAYATDDSSNAALAKTTSPHRWSMAYRVVEGERQVLIDVLETLKKLSQPTGEKRKADVDSGSMKKKQRG